MRTILWILFGMFLMYIVLSILSKRSTTSGGDTVKLLANLAGTPQCKLLIRSNEFREVVKTPEFIAVLGSLTNDELTTVSYALVN